MCTRRREEVSRLRAEKKKRWSSVMQDDKLPPAVFEKGLPDRISPIRTLSQNGYDDHSANAWKHICFLALDKITAAHLRGALGLICFPVRPSRYQRIPGHGFQRRFGPLLQHVQSRCKALWKCPCRLVVARARKAHFLLSV